MHPPDSIPFIDIALVTALSSQFPPHTYQPGEDPAVTAYHAGREDVIAWLYAKCKEQETESLTDEEKPKPEPLRERFKRSPRLKR